MPGFAPPSFERFCYFGSLAIVVQFNFRPMTLRHYLSVILLFVGAILLLHISVAISIQQLF